MARKQKPKIKEENLHGFKHFKLLVPLLIALWTQRKPTLRTYEMICLYFTGLADEEELPAHIAKLAPQSGAAVA